MKKLVIAILLSGFALATQAQGVDFGIKAGLNFANSSFSASGFNLSPSGITSFHGGVYLTGNITESIAIQPELIYSVQGFDFSGGGVTSTDRFNYLQIPVLFRYNIVPAFNLHVGPQYSFLLSANETVGSTTTNVKDQLKSGDFSLVFGAGFDAGKFNGGLRYNLGLTNIDDSGSSGTIKNTILQLYVGLKIAGK